MATFSLPAAGLLVAAPPTLLRHGLLQTLREAWPDYPVSLSPDATRLPALLQQQPCRLLIVDGPALPAPLLPTVLRQVRGLCPQLPLLLLTGRRRPALPPAAGAALRLLPRHAPPAEVVRAVAGLLALGPALPPAPAPAPAAVRPVPAGFSPRELEVLALVVADLCNDEIANQLCLSVRTIESHRRALLHKAGVRTPVGLVVRALREGWLGA